MRIIISTDKFRLKMYFKRPEDALEELKLFIENARSNDTMEYSVVEMTEEQYMALPEVDK